MNNENPYSSSQIQNDRREIVDWPIDEGLEAMMRTRLMTLRIIIFSLILGVLMFAGFVAFKVISENKPLNGWGENNVGFILLGVAISQIAISFVIPRIVASNAVKEFARTSSNQPKMSDKIELFSGLFNVLQTEMIIRAALLEGAAFVALTGVLLYQIVPLAFVAAVVILLLFSIFPRYDAIRARLMQLLRTLQEA